MKKIKYENIIAFLFFIFFTTPILSPSIGNFTVYIHWFIPFLDLKFTKSLFTIKIKKMYAIEILGVAVLIALLGKYVLLLKVVFLILTLIYMNYCKKNNMFKYLYWGVNFNILIGIAQFAFYYINPNIARLIGPTNIAKTIWGNYATDTFTNLYAIFKFVRVSGWSREAGFFASLIIITFLTYMYDDDIKKKNFIQILMFVIGYIISFSKSSFIVIPLVLILVFRKYLNKIPYYISIIGFILCMIIISNMFNITGMYNETNESLVHRISGYSVIFDLNPKEVLVGVDTVKDLNENAIQKNNFIQYIFNLEQYCGIPGLIIHEGGLIAILFFVILRKIKFRTPEIIFLSIATITVDYFTSTSFVVIIYYLCIQMIIKDRIENKEEKQLYESVNNE